MLYLKKILEQKSRIPGNKGVSSLTIDNLEAQLSVKFPQSYREYLLNFGESSGSLLKGYYTELKYASLNRDEVQFMLKNTVSDKHVELKSNFHFFAQWQGYNFFFFECDGNENPPVFILNDSFNLFEYKKSFTEFVIEEGFSTLM